MDKKIQFLASLYHPNNADVQQSTLSIGTIDVDMARTATSMGLQ
jgi:hypothetical protein